MAHLVKTKLACANIAGAIYPALVTLRAQHARLDLPDTHLLTDVYALFPFNRDI